MIKILNFVKGAVAQKDLVPVLTNFHFYNGRVQGGNGRITIDAPLDLNADITVPAIPFLKAVDACDGDPEIHITDGGKLVLKKGSFRSALPLSDPTTFPRVVPPQRDTLIKKNMDTLILALRTIRPFIGEDASRPWSCGCLISKGYIYATNNVVIVRIPWANDAHINLPSFAVDEILRIGEVPDGFSTDGDTATFFYSDQRWLRSQLFEAEWPDVDKFFGDEELGDVPEGLLEAVTKILPFCPDPKYPEIKLSDDGVSTADGDMRAAVNCTMPDGKYRAEPLLMVLERAVSIDLTKYPDPVPFKGQAGLEGVMVGVR